MATTKPCLWCKETKAQAEYAPTSSLFFPDVTIDICYSCLNRRVKMTDLHEVDKLLQWIDVPFFPDDWIDTYETNEEKTLKIYLMKYGLNKYNKNVDWAPTNEVWLAREANGSLQANLKIHNEESMRHLKEKWGDGYTFEEYLKMEGFYADLAKTQSFVTATQRDQAEILCKISLSIHYKLAKGDDISKELKSYNDTIKAAGFEPKNSRNYGDFESTGELMNYLVRKGYQPKFYDGKNRDEVDFTIANQQTYLRRLVLNEPGLQDLVSQRKDAYKISQQLEEEGLDDASLDKYENSGFDLELEGEEDFDESLDNN